MRATPVQYVEKIGTNCIYIKREDLIPVSFGGNKARKALLFFEEIDEGAYDCVVSYGSSSSNHCRVVSNMACSRDMDCYIISPEEASEPTFNSRLMKLFGAEITVVPVEEVHDTIENKIAELTEAGKKPYFIPGGGHGNTGTKAFEECYEEIRRFEAENNTFFDYVFFASGTGTTQAGLVCGQLKHGDDRKIVGISIARKNPRGRNVVLESIGEYMGDAEIISVDAKAIEAATVFDDSYTGGGYGSDTSAATIERMMRQHGIPMDSTYTGKAYRGMEDYIAREGIENSTVLFIHTGGTPLFFDYIEKHCDIEKDCED